MAYFIQLQEKSIKELMAYSRAYQQLRKLGWELPDAQELAMIHIWGAPRWYPPPTAQ
jgi:hypothetical protein